MSLGLVVNGVVYQRAKSIRVNRSIRNFCGWFEATVSANEFDRSPIRVGDKITVIAGIATIIMTGYVESLSVSQSAGDHQIRFSGRDVTADLLDSSLKTKQFKGPIAFDGLINRVLSEQGTLFPVDVRAGELDQIKDRELISGDIGESAFDFIERYARRVQAIVTSGEEGQIIVLRAGSERVSGLIQHVPGLPGNNVLASDLSINNAQRFNEYSCVSQLSPAGVDLTSEVSSVVDQSGKATDGKSRAGRFFEFQAETAMDSKACADRARLESNLRQANSFQYRAVLQGAQTQFKANLLANVRDSVCGVADDLLVTDVGFSFDLNEGTTTEVQATLKGAFAPKPIVEKSGKTDNASEFFSDV